MNSEILSKRLLLMKMKPQQGRVNPKVLVVMAIAILFGATLIGIKFSGH